MSAGTRILGMPPGAARIALALSLAANFLVLGIAGGAALRMGERHERGPGFRLTQQIVAVAAPERKAAVEAALGAPGEADWREASRARWAATAERIAAKPFDAAALEADFAESDARRAEGRAARNAAVAGALALLTDEERAALAEAIRERLEERGKRD